MPYDSLTSRTDVAALIPEETVNVVLENLPKQSAAMSLFRRVPMPTNTLRFPVLSALPVAYFVNGDTGLKQTTEVAWESKYLNVEELAVILPIPEAVADDLEFDIWGSIRPMLEEAIGRTLDSAIFFGTNKPASWPSAIAAAATAAGNVVTRAGTQAAASGGYAGQLDELLTLVEQDGYDVNGLVGNRVVRGLLRAARDTNGQRLLEVNGNVDNYDGIPIVYPMRGLWPSGYEAAELFAGDWTQQVLGIRQDFTYKILDQAVIQDAAGAIQYNLAQQDMVAMRVVFRVAWQTANPINFDQATAANRYPAGVMKSPVNPGP